MCLQTKVLKVTYIFILRVFSLQGLLKHVLGTFFNLCVWKLSSVEFGTLRLERFMQKGSWHIFPILRQTTPWSVM